MPTLKFLSHPIFMLLIFLIVQLLCFGPIITHVGFYLDDWATLSFLHFAPKGGGYLGLLHYYLFNDSRVLIRPLEVLHFGTIYFLVGDKPLLYHAINLVFEGLSAFLFYVLLERLTGKKAAALLGALTLLLYPGHDSTRYWVICSSVSLSLALYLASFLSTVAAADAVLSAPGPAKNKSWIFLSIAFISFMSMLLNYETFLPLAALTFFAVLLLVYRRSESLVRASKIALLTAAPSIMATLLLVVFLKVLVPMLGHGYAHAITLKPQVMIDTIARGLALNLPWQALPFFFSQAASAVAALTSSEIIRLFLILLLGAVPLFFLMRADLPAAEDESVLPTGRLKALDLVLLGLFTIFVSYTIFGLSPDYMPTYTTLVNRVNAGASIGFALILAAVALLVPIKNIGGKALMAAVTILLVALFTLADWGLSKPWIVSWTTQKEVRQAISEIKSKVDDKASLLLVSCPRYVMWSPVFDGVWDFQNMVRITLDRPEFKANVVSERLTLAKDGLKDISYGYECGSYPFDDFYLMVAPHPELIAIKNAAQFVEQVEKRGMTFGFDEKTLTKWKALAAATPKLEPSH